MSQTMPNTKGMRSGLVLLVICVAVSGGLAGTAVAQSNAPSVTAEDIDAPSTASLEERTKITTTVSLEEVSADWYGDLVATLYVNGDKIGSQPTFLADGSVRDLTFQYEFADTGTKDVYITVDGPVTQGTSSSARSEQVEATTPTTTITVVENEARTPQEVPVSNEVFAAIDTNGDGEISILELASAKAAVNNDGQVNGVAVTQADIAALASYYGYENFDDTSGNVGDDEESGTQTPGGDEDTEDGGLDDGPIGNDTNEGTDRSADSGGKTVEKTGSVLTLELAVDAPAAAVQSLPEGASVGELGAGTPQPGGAIWNQPSGETVSFNLTPAASTAVGDTIEFEFYDGSDTRTVSVAVIEEPEVPQVEPPEGFEADNAAEIAGAVASDDGEITPISIAQSISENSQEGTVDGVEITPIEFAQLISANAGG